MASDSEGAPSLCSTDEQTSEEESGAAEPAAEDEASKGKIGTSTEVPAEVQGEVGSLGRDAIDGMDDDVLSAVSSLSALSDVLPGRASVDATNPISKRGEGLAQLNEERKHRFSKSATAATLGISGKTHTCVLYSLRRRLKTGESSLNLRLGLTKHRLGATALYWNKGKLRREDRLDPNFDQRRSMKGMVHVKIKEGHAYSHGNHPRAWTVDGVLELAFAKIGQLCPNRNSLLTTRRSLDAVAGVALAGQAQQEDALQAWHLTLSCMPRDSRPQWVFLGRSSDCTPCRVAFGQLSDLAAVARVWHNPEKGKPSRLITAAAFEAETGKTPGYGIVEVLGQKGIVAWPHMIGDFVSVELEKVILPPLFLERANGSTIFRGLEVASATLSWDNVLALTEVCRFVVVFLGTDLASSCQRLKQEYARRAALHNKSARDGACGVILLVDGQCAAHILHREVEKCFSLRELIPRLYKTAWSCGLPGMHQCLAAALQKIVSEDLASGFFSG